MTDSQHRTSTCHSSEWLLQQSTSTRARHHISHNQWWQTLKQPVQNMPQFWVGFHNSPLAQEPDITYHIINDKHLYSQYKTCHSSEWDFTWAWHNASHTSMMTDSQHRTCQSSEWGFTKIHQHKTLTPHINNDSQCRPQQSSEWGFTKIHQHKNLTPHITLHFPCDTPVQVNTFSLQAIGATLLSVQQHHSIRHLHPYPWECLCKHTIIISNFCIAPFSGVHKTHWALQHSPTFSKWEKKKMKATHSQK